MNVVMLIGRLVGDPDIYYSQKNDDIVIARFSVAINNGKDRKGNDYPATFVQCICFNAPAEYLEKYGVKGARIAVNGKWKSGSYKNDDGDTIYTNECLVNSLQLFDYPDEDEDEEDEEKPQRKTTKNNSKSNTNAKSNKSNKSNKSSKPQRRTSRPNPADADS